MAKKKTVKKAEPKKVFSAKLVVEQPTEIKEEVKPKGKTVSIETLEQIRSWAVGADTHSNEDRRRNLDSIKREIDGIL